MPIGNSREEQELNARLVAELVNPQVMAPMEKIGWGHGTPPPPERTTQGSGQPNAEGTPGNAPQPQPKPTDGPPAPKSDAKPEDAPKPDALSDTDLVSLYESLRDAETGLIARKYKTVKEAIKGNVHLTTMAHQAFSERDALKQRIAELEKNPGHVTSPASPAAGVPTTDSSDLAGSRIALKKAQEDYDAVLAEITEENGGMLDAETSKKLAKAQFALSDASADVRTLERFSAKSKNDDAERAEWDRVDEYMIGRHPESARFSEETALFVKSQPLLASAVRALLSQGDRQGATELAWTSFEKAHADQIATTERTKAEETEEDLAAREQVRKEQVEKARKDAGVVTGSAGGAGGHENKAVGHSREEVEAVREQMRREGEAPGSPAAMRFRQMVIGPSLDPRIFGAH